MTNTPESFGCLLVAYSITLLYLLDEHAPVCFSFLFLYFVSGYVC